MPVINAMGLIRDRVNAIGRYHDQCGIPKAQLDVSGGIDSAVMAMLLVKALGSENCIFDHTIIHTNPEQTHRARELCEALQVPLALGHFNDIYRNIVDEVIASLVDAYAETDIGTGIQERMDSDPTIEGSIKSTLRAPLGRAYNRIMGGGIRHGTGNECEDRWLRFFQKGGDGEVDTNPLAMLSKTEVYQLAFTLGHELGIYDAVKPIIEATPSPDLWGTGDAHSDEAELLDWLGVPFTYGRINPDTGDITRIGTIERVSRSLDCWYAASTKGKQTIGSVLFGDDLTKERLDVCVTIAIQAGLWNQSGPVQEFLKAARRAEAQTRHKMNPNIPTLGTREELVRNGLLTNNLPVEAERKGN